MTLTVSARLELKTVQRDEHGRIAAIVEQIG